MQRNYSPFVGYLHPGKKDIAYMNTQIEIIDQFRAAMAEAGMTTNESIIADGRLHRFHVEGDKRGSKNGAYTLHLNGRPAGYFEHFRSGIRQTWTADGQAYLMTEADRRAIEAERTRREAERQQRYDRAAERARSIYQAAFDAPSDHPYLINKQVSAYPGVKLTTWRRTLKTDGELHRTLIIDHSLLIPLRDESGKIRNLQAIFPAESPELGRSKDFLPGGQLAGCFFTIGERSDPVLICEGYATGATLHAETGYRVYVAFSANNLKAVALLVRKHRPEVKIIICCDNDKTEGNPGLRYGNDAALAVDGFLTYPPIEGYDFNDYAIKLKEAANHE
ncbi:MAG: hypothetical protein Kow0065_13600 [Methylomicrobium sp.]